MSSATNRSKRSPRFRRLVHTKYVQVFALLGSTILLTSCAPRLDTEAIALSIQTDLEQQGDIDFEKVICPDNIEPSVGQSFRCWGKLSEDMFFPIETEQIIEGDQVNAAETVDWKIPTSRGILNLAQLELEFQNALVTEMSEEIEQDLDLPIQVDCGATYRVNTPGETFTCQVENGVIIDARRLENVQITIDSQGNLNWQGVRNLITPEELEVAEAEGLAFRSVEPENVDENTSQPIDQQAVSSPAFVTTSSLN